MRIVWKKRAKDELLRINGRGTAAMEAAEAIRWLLVASPL